MSVVAAAPRPEERTAEPSAHALSEAQSDLRGDFGELLFLCRAADARLASTLAELERARAGLPCATLDVLVPQLEAGRSRYAGYARRLLALERLAAPDREATAALLAELSAAKASHADLLRTEQALAAALSTAADWQSPPFLHSTQPADARAMRIRPHWNDYKRDRHLDGEAYERAYLAEMVSGSAGLRALLTACGMAAFTTIVAFLRDAGRLDGPIVIGQGLYHETRGLLELSFRGSVHAVDERDTAALLRAVDELRPCALFLDSLSNTKWMPVPDLPAVLERLDTRSTYLVIDNTGLSVACQPFALASRRLIVFESLLKYAQLGLDRANAGVIVAREEDAEALAGYREHLGTNVPDVAVHALPPPDRYILERRLARLQRNAAILAERLRELVDDVVQVVYPGLADHPSHAVARRLSFRGGCLSVVFRQNGAALTTERAFVESAIVEAARRRIPLIGGSSFGFDTTRVYLTAAQAAAGEPFVRISPGTEHRLEIDELADALAAAIRKAAR
jgi:cystathionine beta-lyase/cystathionine gamma-synthase